MYILEKHTMATNAKLRNIQRTTEQTSEAISKLCFYAVLRKGTIFKLQAKKYHA